MNMVWWLVLLPFASWLLTGIMRQYALSKNLLDTPNNRSSHTVPTPRGGGLAIVLSFLFGLFLISITEQFKTEVLVSLYGAGGLVAFVGFIDDHRHIDARWRLLMHFIAAASVLFCLGGLPPLPVLGYVVDLGFLGHALAVVYVVWLLNLYNFMDGIDGIAGMEAVTVCLGGTILLIISSAGENIWILPVILFLSVFGFLIWNFPSAKIFMGDVGSGFVGMTLGIFSIQSASVAPVLFWCWIILLGTFVVDATITLLRRLVRGQKLFSAHRSHAYQYASRKLNSHSTVTIIYGVINLVWLLPMATFVLLGWIDGVIALIVAYLPLIYLAIHFKAGATELQDI